MSGGATVGSRPVLDHETWCDRASCRFFDPELWFPSERQLAKAAAARLQPILICVECPVRAECLDGAMEEEGKSGESGRFGIRGGLTPRARALMYRRSRPRGVPA